MGANLVTLAEYKTYVGITSTNQDAEINVLIPIVSQLAKSICKRSFVDYVTEDKVQVYSGGPYLIMDEYPLISVNSVEYSSDYGLTYTNLVEFTDYVVNTEDGSLQSITGDGTFPKQVNAYRVSYNAGFETLPSDLKVAVMDCITYYLKSDMAVKSQRNAGSNTTQIEYITKNTLPAHIARVFDLYISAVN